MREPRSCPDCGTVELSRHSFEECCAMLKEQRDLATQRAEAAEAEKYAYKYVPHLHGYLTDNGILPNDIVRTICSSQHQHQGAMSAVSALAESHELLRAERDALRADNAVLSEEIHMQLIELGMKRIGDHMSQYFRADDECGDAALAVQP